jgi:sterol desaturase/sphingolipid hydroxylase (fatty acid hydroxylase superfamily)
MIAMADKNWPDWPSWRSRRDGLEGEDRLMASDTRRRFVPLLHGVLLAAAGGAVLLLERRRRARAYVERPATHHARNLALAGLAAAAVHVLEAPAAEAAARTVARRQRGLVWHVPAPAWLRDILAVLLLDYTLYLWHILTHRVPLLWRFHLVHHVDLDLDASTGVRFHAGEIAASVPWRVAQVIVIGVTPRALRWWQTLTLAAVLFHHSNARLSPRLERVLCWIVATPKMHAIHHSIDPDQLQSNFSSGLAIWDRLHRTARFDAEPEDVTVGVLGHLSPRQARLGRVLLLPFVPAMAGPGTAPSS